MTFQSKNMNYIFNVEYFNGLNLMKTDKASENKIAENNNEIRSFDKWGNSPLDEWRNIPGYQEFALYTTYPGLLMGEGNPHKISISGAIKSGFSFDYVNGLPFLPGSSLKGILRSYFPSMLTRMSVDEKENHISFLKYLVGDTIKDINKWEDSIFENGDIFLGAYPERREAMMEMDYITSHKERFKNPIPVNIIKVKPNVKFVFSFVLKGTEEEVECKKKLFKELLLIGGIGAKTNVGFGRLSDKVSSNIVNREPKCKNCGAPVGINPNTKKYNIYCSKCYRESKNGKKV